MSKKRKQPREMEKCKQVNQAVGTWELLELGIKLASERQNLKDLKLQVPRLTNFDFHVQIN